MTSKHNNADTELPWKYNQSRELIVDANHDPVVEVVASNMSIDELRATSNLVIKSVNQHYENKALISELVEGLEQAEQGQTLSDVLANYRRIRRAALSKAKGGEA